MSSLPPIAAQVFDRLAATFDQSHTGSAETVLLDVGGCLVRIRSTAPSLLRQVLRPLACPQRAASSPAAFTVDLIDLGEHPLPNLPWPPQRVSLEQETSEYTADQFVFTRHGDVLLSAQSLETNRTVALVHAPERWPLRHYKQAIFITLYQHLRRRGLHLIHASAIGQHGRAALIAGHSGAGKTTTMLTCVAAGFQFLGDDTTLLQRSPAGQTDVITLLSTMDLTDKTAAWFPQLAAHLSPQRSHTGKRQIILSEAFPASVAAQAQVSVILAPEITGQADTILAPASKASLLSDLLYYSVDLHNEALTRRHVEFLAQVVEQTPVYRLLLGHDRRQIPVVIGQLLQTV